MRGLRPWDLRGMSRCLALLVWLSGLVGPVAKAAEGARPGPFPLAARNFLIAGEWDVRNPLAQAIRLVKDGAVTWSYSVPLYTVPFAIQEFSDLSLLPNGNILYACMTGAGIVTPAKDLVWQFRCPPGTETHSCQMLADDRVLLALNGPVGKVLLINIRTSTIEKEVLVPTASTFAHYQFRRVRLTPGGKSFMVGLLAEKRVVELDFDGKVLWSCPAIAAWSAIRLGNGNTLISGDGEAYTREVDASGRTVWEFTQRDTAIRLYNTQTANRLANGNTVICNWVAGNKTLTEWPSSVQALEVTPDKRVVWALSAWDAPDLGPCTCIQYLEEVGDPPAILYQEHPPASLSPP